MMCVLQPLPVTMPEPQSVLDAAEGAQDSPRPRRIAESIDVLSTVGTPGVSITYFYVFSTVYLLF